MKDQLIKLLTHFNLSATRFAEEIGVQRSSISHILSGRNKPSYDFIVKIMEKYPTIDPAWLLTGNGEMLTGTGEPSGTNKKDAIRPSELFTGTDETPGENISQTKNKNDISVDISKQINNITNVNNIESVILLYTNGTFSHFKKSE
jgi:transcriptional regulator with XRE-family HTH domain